MRFMALKAVLIVHEPEELMEAARLYGMEGSDLAGTLDNVFRAAQLVEPWDIFLLYIQECEEPPF